jgi:predicted transcriptional regulator
MSYYLNRSTTEIVVDKERAVPQEGRARPRGALEQEVLACLAAAGQPLAPGGVLAGLGGQLAYTTVMTTLSRLHAKGAVTRKPAGRGYVYALRGGTGDAQASMTAHRMLRLLEGGSDRASVLSRFIADLSPADEQLLTGLLADGQQAAGPPGKPAGPGPAAGRAGSPATPAAGRRGKEAGHGDPP